MMLLHDAVKNLPLSVKREHSRLSCSLQGETLTQCFSLKKRLNTTLRILKKLLQILSTRLHNRPIVPAVFFAAEKLSPNSFEKIRRSCWALRVLLTTKKNIDSATWYAYISRDVWSALNAIKRFPSGLNFRKKQGGFSTFT